MVSSGKLHRNEEQYTAACSSSARLLSAKTEAMTPLPGPASPVICLIDEEPRVHAGWQEVLGDQVYLRCFFSPEQLLEAPRRLASCSCLIISRLFDHKSRDIIRSVIPEKIRLVTPAPIFLNWQGYISKSDLETNFDGKIYQRYGVTWAALQQRIARINKARKLSRREIAQDPSSSLPESAGKPQTRERLCLELLKKMAANASGEHRAKIESFVRHDPGTGIKFLEAIYNRLLTSGEVSPTCPSRYLNSSPVIAKRMLGSVLSP